MGPRRAAAAPPSGGSAPGSTWSTAWPTRPRPGGAFAGWSRSTTSALGSSPAPTWASSGSGMRVLVPLAARRSHRIIVDAASTREDLRRELGTPPEKVDVVPLGLGAPQSQAQPMPEADVREWLGARRTRRSRCASPPSAPHKNLARLIGAVALIPPTQRPLLALPGYSTPHEDELRARAAELGVTDSVRFLDWVSAEAVEGLYAAGGGVRVPVPARGLRAARAGGDGPRGAGGVLEPRIAGRGGGRRRAALRPAVRGIDRRCGAARFSATPHWPSGCGPPGADASRALHVGGDRRCDAADLSADARRNSASGHTHRP